jgi:hypothetical protein
MDWLIMIGIYILEGMFVLGVIGSVLVLILSGEEDLKTAMEPDEESSH